MRRRLLWALAAVGVAVVLVPGPAGAITYGEPDAPNPHKNVGAVLADYDPDNPGIEELCSGTLISSTVFLTAAHCTQFLESLGTPNDEIWVSFDADVDPVTSSTKLFRGTWFTHPQAWQDASDPKDLAVIRFARPMLPPFVEWMRIENLRVGSGSVDLMLRRHPRDVSINVVRSEGDVGVAVFLEP